MVINLRGSTSIGPAIQILRRVHGALGDVRGAGGTSYERLDGWRIWSGRAITQVAQILAEHEIERLVLGSRFELLQTMDPASSSEAAVAALIDAEMDSRLEQLDSAVKDLQHEWDAWSNGDSTAIVIDTNVLVDYGARLRLVDWHDLANHGYLRRVVVVLPIQVIEELDGLKDRGTAAQRQAARSALRWLDGTFQHWHTTAPLTETQAPEGREPRLRIWVDDNDRVPLPRTDADIIDRVLGLQPFAGEIILLSQDRSMQLRARSLGIEARHLPKAAVPTAAHLEGA